MPESSFSLAAANASAVHPSDPPSAAFTHSFDESFRPLNVRQNEDCTTELLVTTWLPPYYDSCTMVRIPTVIACDAPMPIEACPPSTSMSTVSRAAPPNVPTPNMPVQSSRPPQDHPASGLSTSDAIIVSILTPLGVILLGCLLWSLYDYFDPRPDRATRATGQNQGQSNPAPQQDDSQRAGEQTETNAEQIEMGDLPPRGDHSRTASTNSSSGEKST